MAQRREDPTGSRPGRQRGMLAHPSAEPGAADTLHRHAELLQSSSDAIFTTTPEGAIVSCNPAAERLYGHRATAVIGQPFELLAPPERAAELARLLDGLRRGGRPDPVEYVVTRPDGRAVGISLSLSPIPNSRGGLAGVLAISRDITAHTRAEEQLRKALSQLAQAESLARLGSWEWDLRSDTVAWSAELYRLCGVKPEHLRATLEGALEFVHPDDRAFVREVIARARRDGVPYVCEHRIVRPDGAVRSFQSRGTVVVDDLGQPVKLVGTGQDITERKQAEDALARYAALIESSEDAIVTQSLEGRILTWNPGAERLYGHRGEEVAGRLLAIVEPPERAGELEGLLARVQRGEHIEHHETVRMRKDGARGRAHADCPRDPRRARPGPDCPQDGSVLTQAHRARAPARSPPRQDGRDGEAHRRNGGQGAHSRDGAPPSRSRQSGAGWGRRIPVEGPLTPRVDCGSEKDRAGRYVRVSDAHRAVGRRPRRRPRPDTARGALGPRERGAAPDRRWKGRAGDRCGPQPLPQDRQHLPHPYS